MSNICFIVNSPFSKRDLARFGISEIQDRKFNVLILDCTPIFDNDYDKAISGNDICIKNKFVKRCYKLRNLLNYLIEFQPKYCVNLLGGFSINSYLERVLIRILLKILTKTIEYRLFTIPDENIKSKDLKILFREVFKNIILSILSLPWTLIQSDIVAISGFYEFKKIKPRQKVIFAHNLDYDIFLKNQKSRIPLIKTKSLLFLDEDFPCHVDYIRTGKKPINDEKKYYKDISFLLKNLSRSLNLNPIVKLHPRANVEKCSSLYDVPISTSNTVKLIFESDLVLAHCSTSIQLAVLCYKPIILIMPNELNRKSYWAKLIEIFALKLNLQIIEVDHINRIKYIPSVDKEKYKNYISDYIKTPNSLKSYSWELITDNLN